VEDVGQACQAGTVCGGCRPTISALVAGEPVDAGVISLGKARVRERVSEVEVQVDVEVEVEVAVRANVARAS
jgi:hypothetical protein